MFAFVRRYEIERCSRTDFEAAFGASGAWARLFAQSPDYRGIELFRDGDTYLVFCIWESKAALDRFAASYASDLAELEGRTGKLAKCGHAFGEYEVLEPA